MSKKPIAIEITHIKDKIGNPVITLSSPVIPFVPGQLIHAVIYKDKIIITPKLPEVR